MTKIGAAKVDHVIWDWNGTLLHDLPMVVSATNACLALEGIAPISVDHYRMRYTRPVKVFHEQLIGRDLSDPEWARTDGQFLACYRQLEGRAELAPDALESLRRVQSLGISQSILSMLSHEMLIKAVARRQIDHFFSRVQGSTNHDAGTKTLALMQHIFEIRCNPDRTLLIGDSIDDARAAGACGISFVLVANGSSHLEQDLIREGPLARDLREAVHRYF